MTIQRWLCLLGLITASAIAGCNSISSTMLQRSEDNNTWTRGPRSQGVPITLKVPTHLRVEVREKQFLELVDGSVEPLKLDVPLRSVFTAMVKTEKVFTVDPKRPAAGVLTSTLDFQGQYFKSIKYKNEDKTIETINKAITDLTKPGGILSGTGTNVESTIDPNLMETNSVVASALFEIDDPNFECQLKEFLDKHLTGCHTCNVVAPGVQPLKPYHKTEQ